jgi:hypothetical protein
VKFICSDTTCRKIFEHSSSNLVRVSRDAYQFGWWRQETVTGRQWFCGDHPRNAQREPSWRPAPRTTPPAEPAQIRPTPAMRCVLPVLVDADAPMWSGDIARHAGIPFGTTYAALRVLMDRGWVDVCQDPSPRKAGPPRHLYFLVPAARERVTDILTGD